MLFRSYEKYTADGNKWLTFRNNFIDMVVETAYLYGISNSEVHEVVQKIKQLSGRNFAVAYRKNPFIEQMIYGYHIYMEFAVDDILANPSYKDNFISDWEDFKQSIGLIVDENK